MPAHQIRWVSASLVEIPRCGSHVTVFSYGRPPSLRRRRNGTIDNFDAVSETRNAGGAFFPLAAWAQKQLTAPPRQAVNNLQRALLEHGGNNLNDDIVVVILKTS